MLLSGPRKVGINGTFIRNIWFVGLAEESGNSHFNWTGLLKFSTSPGLSGFVGLPGAGVE